MSLHDIGFHPRKKKHEPIFPNKKTRPSIECPLENCALFPLKVIRFWLYYKGSGDRTNPKFLKSGKTKSIKIDKSFILAQSLSLAHFPEKRSMLQHPLLTYGDRFLPPLASCQTFIKICQISDRFHQNSSDFS